MANSRFGLRTRRGGVSGIIKGIVGVPGNIDPDALSYIQAVEFVDAQELEIGVINAINSFVTGCKADGIWDAIKSSCILAGARTLTGALVPLKGTAPTSFNFVSGDYNRKTGLIGNGTNKYLNSNRASNEDPQNNNHLSVLTSQISSGSPAGAPYYLGATSGSTGAKGLFRSLVGFNLTQHGVLPNSSVSFTAGSNTPPIGFIGYSRTGSSTFVFRVDSTNNNGSTTSQTPASDNVFVFSRNNGSGTAERYSNGRLQFYSIGEALDLALLEARLTTLMNEYNTFI
jgi:hypothetical protein